MFAKTSGDIRSKETEMRKLDKLHASSTTAIVKATHQLFRVKQELKELQDQHQDITFLNIDDQINLLKDGLKLSGMTHQKMERIRRESFRSSLPAGLKGLLEEPTECYDAAKEKYWLFGNDLRK